MFSSASNAFSAAFAPAVEPAAEQIGASGEDNARDASTAISLDETDLTVGDPSHQMLFDMHATATQFKLSAPEDTLPQENQALSGADLARAALNVDSDQGPSTAQEEKINKDLENHSRGRHAGQSTHPQTPPSLTVKKVTTPPATEEPTMDASATPSRRSQRAQSQQANPPAPGSAKKTPSSTTGTSEKEASTGEKRKRGRPPKAREEGDGTEATKRAKVSETDTPRRRGRPPKTGTTPASAKKPTATPGRGRGRPRKSEGPAREEKPKVLNPDGTPRGRGRPRKSDAAIVQKTTTPPKTSAPAANGTRGRGRPRKSDAASAAPQATSPVSEKKTKETAKSVPRGPGRPKKVVETASEARKEARAATNGTPKRRGRPRKSE